MPIVLVSLWIPTLSVELLQISGYRRYLVFQLSCSLIKELGSSYSPNSLQDTRLFNLLRRSRLLLQPLIVTVWYTLQIVDDCFGCCQLVTCWKLASSKDDSVRVDGTRLRVSANVLPMPFLQKNSGPNSSSSMCQGSTCCVVYCVIL